MPKYIAIAAITLDGKIAKGPNHPSDWTSKEDKRFMRGLLDKSDVVIVGNNTYKTAIKPLSRRNCIVLARSVNSPPARGGVPRLQSGRGGGRQNLTYINPQKSDIKKLIRARKYKTVAILGGAQTYTYCLQNNMLDELYLTIEPLVFGRGIDLFSPIPSSPGEERMPDSPAIALAAAGGQVRSKSRKFKLLSIKKLNAQGSLLLRYKKLSKITIR
jgi:dihydrofolate reductase